MSRWFVGSSRTQHVGLVDQELARRTRARSPPLRRPIGFVDVVAAEEHGGEHVADVLLVDAVAVGGDLVHDGVLGVEIVEALVVVPDA